MCFEGVENCWKLSVKLKDLPGTIFRLPYHRRASYSINYSYLAKHTIAKPNGYAKACYKVAVCKCIEWFKLILLMLTVPNLYYLKGLDSSPSQVRLIRFTRVLGKLCHILAFFYKEAPHISESIISHYGLKQFLQDNSWTIVCFYVLAQMNWSLSANSCTTLYTLYTFMHISSINSL